MTRLEKLRKYLETANEKDVACLMIYTANNLCHFCVKFDPAHGVCTDTWNDDCTDNIEAWLNAEVAG